MKYSIDDSEFRRKLNHSYKDSYRKMELLATYIAKEVVANARSLNGPTVPGASENRAGNYIPKEQRSPRKAHPGNWADVTSQLSSSIHDEIKKGPNTVTAVIKATAEYAAALDAKTGYSVLGGADVAARKGLKKYYPKYFD